MSARATRFHANPWKGVFYATGGGSSLIHEMLGTAGASGTVLEARVPYAFTALTELLGRAPEQAVSETTARQLAVAAYERAQRLSEDTPLFGFGLTAALATNRTKKGACRVHWAVQTATRTTTYHVEYSHALDRVAQEQQLLEDVWTSLEDAFSEDPAPLDGIARKDAIAPPEIARLLGDAPAKHTVSPHDGSLLLSGSFNPVHEGHRKMLEIGERLTGRDGAFELCVRNADKPNLDFLTIEERLAQFSDTPVWLTNAANFVAKARLFPGSTFLLGIDTLVRVGDRRFYNDSQAELSDALAELGELETRFIVFGRDRAGEFETLSTSTIPDRLEALCTEVPQTEFDNDVSSTEIRRAAMEGDSRP